ncbi:MAG: chloride channel protein [Alphaproteobacteria bacterium]
MMDNVHRFTRHEHFVMSVLSVIFGLLGGAAGIVFRETIGLIQAGFFGSPSDLLAFDRTQIEWWRIPLATTAGGLIVGLLVYYLMPGRRPYAVADVIEASALRGGRMNLRVGLGAALISATTLGSGGSAGREGPVVHLAASLCAFLGERLKLGPAMQQTVLGCGVAAGVAASFNAPIAGVFFALEVVVGHYALAAFAPVVIASVTGTLVSRIYFGDFPAFVIPPHEITSFWEFPAFALLGVVSAIGSILFIKSVGFSQKVFSSIPKLPVWARPALGGLALGIIGIFLPEVLGVGYFATDQALRGELPLLILFTLIVAKTAATAITLGSGGGGGVFSPSLFIGAMIGGTFGVVATLVQPELSSGHSAYTLIGMGAMSGAVLGAPISTILIVFELTGDYELTIGVMIATVIASQISLNVLGFSFFSWQLHQRGVSLKGGREAAVMRSRSVRDVMKDDLLTVGPGASLERIRGNLIESAYGELFVVDGSNRLIGTITLRDLAQNAFEHEKDDVLTAGDIARRDPPTACVTDTIETAISILESCREEHIAVLDTGDAPTLVGVLHERDVLAAYHRAVLATRPTEPT